MHLAVSELKFVNVGFGEESKIGVPEKNLSGKGREPTTNSTCRVRESIPDHIGGRQDLSPPHHPCYPIVYMKVVHTT